MHTFLARARLQASQASTARCEGRMLENAADRSACAQCPSPAAAKPTLMSNSTAPRSFTNLLARPVVEACRLPERL